ncbi:glycosyltransferase family 4 protein [Variovorax sp. PBL-E5]|uniref:glycosyltransferase family 4 protein n=1 Tax=Variovorax sp. PBL-E5 TaxID=434014 RepID=UPI0013172572|nr:glycosyltransferase [Variovorax sp. PBL-E5]VTU25864.1 GDP-mannose-dependent alpha-(1-2)-phosphatidylinositol mannosyltransferase [Variovorax sp. PBL-E5]
MKILSITPTYFPEVGGIESVVRELAMRTGGPGIQVDVAHVSANHPAFSVSQHDGLDVYRVPVLGNRLAGYARGFGRLAAGYDLLHVHDPQLMMITGNVLLQAGRIPAVLSTHGGFHHTQKYPAIKWLHEHVLMRRLLGHYRRILGSSESDTAYFSRFSDRVEKCENGIAYAKFQNGRRTGAADPTRWIYWGRWSANKRIDAVIDTVALARDHGIAIDLLIAGPDFDHLGESFKAKIEALQLGASIRMHPYIEDDALLRELQQRTVFITGSEYEGFGVGILEAMAAGKIVVCRDMKPINGFVERAVNGFFLDFDGGAGDLAVVREIASLDAPRCEAMSNAAQHSAKRYDWDSVAARFSAHYANALGAASRPR